VAWQHCLLLQCVETKRILSRFIDDGTIGTEVFSISMACSSPCTALGSLISAIMNLESSAKPQIESTRSFLSASRMYTIQGYIDWDVAAVAL